VVPGRPVPPEIGSSGDRVGRGMPVRVRAQQKRAACCPSFVRHKVRNDTKHCQASSIKSPVHRHILVESPFGEPQDLPLQGRGRRFESVNAHSEKSLVVLLPAESWPIEITCVCHVSSEQHRGRALCTVSYCI
jgi:hypothetical protein